MLEQTSLSIKAAIFEESPSVNPNYMFDWPSLVIAGLSFSINQGVRQGGVLSTHLYKQYLNELLNDLENHNIGISIGNTYAGCPTCADDIVLLSLNNNEMQEMLDIVLDYAGDHRFHFTVDASP
jgi:hypothetical protein